MRKPDPNTAAFERLDPGDRNFDAICARIIDVLEDVDAHPATVHMALAYLAAIAIADIDDARLRSAVHNAFVSILDQAALHRHAQGHFDA